MNWYLSQDCEIDNSYNNETTTEYGFKRKYDHNEIDVIATCYTCGVLLTTFEDVYPENGQTFCSLECVADYYKLMEE